MSLEPSPASHERRHRAHRALGISETAWLPPEAANLLPPPIEELPHAVVEAARVEPDEPDLPTAAPVPGHGALAPELGWTGGPGPAAGAPPGVEPASPGVEPAPVPYGEGLHAAFESLNRRFWAPILRAGLGPFFANPLTGYPCLLRTRGRKSGLTRTATLDYAIHHDAIYVIAGYGDRTHWYRNLLADPHVEVILPTRSVAGLAEDVTDPDEWLARLRDVIRAAGLVGFLLGVNPMTVSDDVLRERARGIKVVRIRVPGLAAGPADPGGLLWIPMHVASTIGAVWLCRRLFRAVSRLTVRR